MAEYIEREAAIESFRKSLDGGYVLTNDAQTTHILQSLPAADVRPVLRGNWIDHQEGRWIYAKCSECCTVHDVKSNFCPNCGADMRRLKS